MCFSIAMILKTKILSICLVAGVGLLGSQVISTRRRDYCFRTSVLTKGAQRGGSSPPLPTKK